MITNIPTYSLKGIKFEKKKLFFSTNITYEFSFIVTADRFLVSNDNLIIVYFCYSFCNIRVQKVSTCLLSKIIKVVLTFQHKSNMLCNY